MSHWIRTWGVPSVNFCCIKLESCVNRIRSSKEYVNILFFIDLYGMSLKLCEPLSSESCSMFFLSRLRVSCQCSSDRLFSRSLGRKYAWSLLADSGRRWGVKLRALRAPECCVARAFATQAFRLRTDGEWRNGGQPCLLVDPRGYTCHLESWRQGLWQASG